MDFERINALFTVLAHCRDLPQYKVIRQEAEAELKDWEDGVRGNDKPEPVTDARTGLPKGQQPKAPEPVVADPQPGANDFTKPTVGRRVP